MPQSEKIKHKILNYIRSNPSGLTIKEIANGIHASINTVSKYVIILEFMKEIFSSKIGAYTLYFPTERVFLHEKLILKLYEGFLKALKQEFPNKEKIFKKIGNEMGKYFKLNLEYISGFFENSTFITDLSINTILLRFTEGYPYFDVFQKDLEITSINIDKEEKKGLYRLHKSNLLINNDDFIYHFFIITGLIENTLTSVLKRKVISNVENINISKKPEDIYVDISVKIF